MVAPPNCAPNTSNEVSSDLRKKSRRDMAGDRPGARRRAVGSGLLLLRGPGERQPEDDREDVEHQEDDDRGDDTVGERERHRSKNTPWAHGQIQL